MLRTFRREEMKYESLFPRRDIVIELAEKGKEAEAVLLAWSIVEMNLDSAILWEHRMSTQSPEYGRLLDIRLSDKIRELRKLGHLSNLEASKVWEFKEKRDKLFHLGGLFFSALVQPEKDALVQTAIEAKDVSHMMVDRASNRFRLT